MLCVSPCVILPLSAWLQFVTLALVLLLPLLISMDASDPVGGIAADDLGDIPDLTVGDIAADVLGDIPDLTVGEYKELAGRSPFQCSLFDEPGQFYQEHNCKTLPILTVKHTCLFARVDMYVCVALSIIVVFDM